MGEDESNLPRQSGVQEDDGVFVDGDDNNEKVMNDVQPYAIEEPSSFSETVINNKRDEEKENSHELTDNDKKSIETRLLRLESEKNMLSRQLLRVYEENSMFPHRNMIGAVIVLFVSALLMLSGAPSALLPDIVDGVIGNATKPFNVFEIPRQFLNETFYSVFPPELGVGGGLLGKRLRNEEGLLMKHPVVILPGFTTIGLELWQPHQNCSHSARARVWGTLGMTGNIASDPICWMKQMALNITSGLDPNGIKVRPVDGFIGATEFNEVYWIWNMVLDNLVAVGYDSNNVFMCGYDWRLSVANNEKRDATLSKLKSQIEIMHALNGEKVVIYGHSMGGQVMSYFLKWVESENGGKGGKNWVAEHIHAAVGIAAANLGMPKAVSAIASGEMKDTSQLGVFNQLIELMPVTSRLMRVGLFQSWRSLFQMLPKGGNALWGDGESPAPDDLGENGTCAYLLKSTTKSLDDGSAFGVNIIGKDKNTPLSETTPEADEKVEQGGVMPNVTCTEFLDEFMSVQYPYTKAILEEFSFGYTETDLKKNNDDPTKWYNNLETELPNAPDMTYYSIYGVGKATERGYAYQAANDYKKITQGEGIRYHINVSHTEGTWKNGVCFHTGDGTLPLISLGYLGAKQWRTPTHNPYGVRIVSREVQHKPHPLYARGGENTGDHVDIMGNIDLNEDLIRIACGGLLEDNFVSHIREISEDAHKRLQRHMKSKSNI
eukprot:CFRG0516T1